MDQLRLKLYEYIIQLTDLGVPITRSLELAATDLADLDVSYAMTAAADRLLRGERLHDALSLNESLFPPLSLTVIGMAEEIGVVPEALELLAKHYRHYGLSPEDPFERTVVLFELLALKVSPLRAQTVLTRRAPHEPSTVEVSLAVESAPPLHLTLEKHAPVEACALLEAVGTNDLPVATWRGLADYLRIDWTEQATAKTLFLGSLCLGAGLAAERIISVLQTADVTPEIGSFLDEWRVERKLQPWAAIMRRFPRLFTSAAAELVQVAEQSGNLEQTLMVVARGMRRGMFQPTHDS